MPFRRFLLGLALGLLTLGTAQAETIAPEASPTDTIAIIGGLTEVEVTIDLASVGLIGVPFGTATVDTAGENPVFGFPITGGSASIADPALALIEHEGSGLSLFDGSQTVTVGNFLIDTGEAAVFGDVIGSDDTLRLFDFGAIGNQGIELLINVELAGALTAIFGAPDLATATFGFANTAPVTAGTAPIPLPAAGWMLLGALAGLAGLRRRAA